VCSTKEGISGLHHDEPSRHGSFCVFVLFVETRTKPRLVSAMTTLLDYMNTSKCIIHNTISQQKNNEALAIYLK